MSKEDLIAMGKVEVFAGLQFVLDEPDVSLEKIRAYVSEGLARILSEVAKDPSKERLGALV